MPVYLAECGICGKQQDYVASVEDRANTPMCCGAQTQKILTAARVTADITPYFTVAADKETGRCQHIRSRKQHREFLKRNGYEEVGNEKPKTKPQSPDAASFIWGKPH